jgi:hypothetical protein
MSETCQACEDTIPEKGVSKINTDIETQFAIDTMNAVPTPRFEVGAVLLTAQLLGDVICKGPGQRKSCHERPGRVPFVNYTHLHDEWEQGVSAAHNQEARKVAHAMRHPGLSGQYDIASASD